MSRRLFLSKINTNGALPLCLSLLLTLQGCKGEEPGSADTTQRDTDSATETGLYTTDTEDTGTPRSYQAELGEDGSVTISIGDDTYTIATQLSNDNPELSWSREMVLEADRIILTDTVTSTGEVDLGCRLQHYINASSQPDAVHLSGNEITSVEGGALNPTTLMTLPSSQLGTIPDDAPGWVQFWANSNGESLYTGLQGVHLPPGESHEFTLILYPLDGGDYWDFINRVRVDFAPSLTVPHWDFGPSQTLWGTAGALEPYLESRDLQVGAGLPFLDYDNSWMADGYSIEEQRQGYIELSEEALAAIHEVDPSLVVLTELEGVFTQLSAEQSAILYEALPEAARTIGYPKTLTLTQQAILESWEHPSVDSMPLNDDGRGSYELYIRDDTPLIALLTYPEEGSLALEALKDQVAFSLVEVGAGGFFLDGGGPVNDLLDGPGSDGVSAIIDPQTGALMETRRDYRLILSPPLVEVMQSALDDGAFVAANGFGFTPELTRLDTLRFMETGWLFNPLDVLSDGRPQRIDSFATGHIGSPVALGNVPDFYGAENQAAEFIMRDVIAHLAHGLLYGGYNTAIPDNGRGAGSWDALNAMYPITPDSIHPGWIIGDERIITAVSGQYVWPNPETPAPKCFAINGESTPCEDVTLTQEEGYWLVDLTLDDWDEVAVIDEVVAPLDILAFWSMDDEAEGEARLLMDEVGERHFDNVLSPPQFSSADPAEGSGFTTGWDGVSTGLYHIAPGFVEATEWTFEAWYRRSDATATGCIYGNGHIYDYAGLARVCLTEGDQIEAKLVGGSAGITANDFDLVQFSAPSDSEWHHIGITWRRGEAHTYLDHVEVGAPQATPNYDGQLMTDYTYLTIGFTNDTNGLDNVMWSGDIDAIRITTEALEPSQFMP